MTPYKPGDVVLVRFPFTDLASTKKRPAIVLSPPDYSILYGDVIALALTSQPQDRGFELKEWRKAGLPKKTWIKPILATISNTVIVRRLGTLCPSDVAGVAGTLRTLLDPGFIVGEEPAES